MHRLVRHSGQDVDRFSISCRWQHMKPWNLQRWSISSEVGAPAVSVPGWQRQHPRRPHHHEANDRAEGSDCCLQTRIDLLLEELWRSHEFFHVPSPAHPICAGTPPALADVLIVLQRGVHVLMQDGIMKVNVVEKLSDTELKARWHMLALGKFTCCLVIWWTATFCCLCVILYYTLCLVLGGGIPVNIEVPSSIWYVHCFHCWGLDRLNLFHPFPPL